MDSIDPAVQALVDEYNKWTSDRWSSQVQEAREDFPLYHYTNAQGLKGIIENQEFWLTSIAHLNDPYELGYGMGVASAMFHSDTMGNELVGKLYEKYESIAVEPLGFITFFVGSFTRDRDDLAQWRAYANNGAGYCVKVSRKAFDFYSDPANKLGGISLLPIQYQMQPVQRNLYAPISKALEILRRSSTIKLLEDQKLRSALLDALASVMRGPIISECLTVKHHSFEYENEIRVTLTNSRKKLAPYIKTRIRGSAIVPYVPLKIYDKAHIEEILVGPAFRDENRHLATDGLENLLAANDFPTSTRIRPANVPYRQF